MNDDVRCVKLKTTFVYFTDQTNAANFEFISCGLNVIYFRL